MTERPDTPRQWARIVGDVRGREPGPTLHCQGGIHGNEPAGLFAAEVVCGKLNAAIARDPSMLRGRLIAFAGHLEALHTGDPSLRYFDRDLNRMFDPSEIERARATPGAERDHEQGQALELLALLEDLAGVAPPGSALMDLHTFSSPGPPFAYVEDSLPARRFGLALGLPLIVGLEEELRGLCADYVTNRLGLLSLVVEAGTHADPESRAVHEAAIWAALGTLGMVADPDGLAGFDVRARLRVAAGAQAGRFFDIRQRVTVGDPPLDMLDHAQAFTRVWMGRTRVASRTPPLGAGVVRAPAPPPPGGGWGPPGGAGAPRRGGGGGAPPPPPTASCSCPTARNASTPATTRSSSSGPSRAGSSAFRAGSASGTGPTGCCAGCRGCRAIRPMPTRCASTTMSRRSWPGTSCTSSATGYTALARRGTTGRSPGW